VFPFTISRLSYPSTSLAPFSSETLPSTVPSVSLTMVSSLIVSELSTATGASFVPVRVRLTTFASADS